MHYLDFDLLVTPASGEFEARVLRSPAGEARHRFAAPFEPLELENLLLRLGRPRRSAARGGFDTDGTRAAKKLGARLYEAAFNGDVRVCLGASLKQAEAEQAGLRIRLRIDAPELADVPWEYLYDAGKNRFLVLSSNMSLVRYLEVAESPRVPSIGRPLRILVVISSPHDLPALDTEREWRNLNEALAMLPRGTVEVIRVEPSLAELQTQLRRAPVHVFHYIGHGDFVEDAQDGLIFLEDEGGRSVPVPAEKLAILLHNQPSLRLAVLNCCEGARTAEERPFSGIAPALVQQGLSAVVAMQFPIADTAAVEFARSFYQSIADGRSIDAALLDARLSMYLEEDEYFGAPVLHMRSDDGVLFDVVSEPAPARVAAQPDPGEPAVPPSAPQPPVFPPTPQPSRFTRTGAVAFGVVWSVTSVMTATFGFYPDTRLNVAWDSVRCWSRAGLVLGLLHAVLIYGVRKVRSFSGAPSIALWSIGGAVAGAIAAFVAIAGFASEPRRIAVAACLFAVVYSLLQLTMLHRYVVRPLTLVVYSAAAGGAFAAAFQVIESNPTSTDSQVGVALLLLFVASILLLIQGALLGRDPIVAVPPVAVSARRQAFIATFVLLLFLATLIPGQ